MTNNEFKHDICGCGAKGTVTSDLSTITLSRHSKKIIGSCELFYYICDCGLEWSDAFLANKNEKIVSNMRGVYVNKNK